MSHFYLQPHNNLFCYSAPLNHLYCHFSSLAFRDLCQNICLFFKDKLTTTTTQVDQRYLWLRFKSLLCYILEVVSENNMCCWYPNNYYRLSWTTENESC